MRASASGARQQIEEAMHIADKYLLDRFVVNQPQYNMLHRDIEKEIIPVSQKHGVGQVVFSPLAQGMLTGKYKSVDDIPADSRAANDKMNVFFDRLLNEKTIGKALKIKAIADGLGIPTAQLALAWILRQPNVSSALVGASRPEQLEQNVKASGYSLSEQTLEQIEQALL